jgi:hypothetical protein
VWTAFNMGSQLPISLYISMQQITDFFHFLIGHLLFFHPFLFTISQLLDMGSDRYSLEGILAGRTACADKEE